MIILIENANNLKNNIKKHENEQLKVLCPEKLISLC